MNWTRKGKYYADSGPYRICWDDARPTLFKCSYKKEFIGKSRDHGKAKKICEDHLSDVSI